MQIDAIDVYHVSMPLVRPFRTAFDDTHTIESILVRLTSGDAHGWGEAAPWAVPAYSPECAAGAFLVITRFLAPRLVGEDVPSGRDLQERLACVKGNPFAKAALDLAWWDLHARLRGEPLWRVLGGAAPGVAVGADFGVLETPAELVQAVRGAVAAGYPRVKLKVRPGWEADVVGAVRRVEPDATIHVDCNSAYTLADTALFRALDELDLAMIEQPLAHDDLLDHAALQKQIRTPVCLDESITSPAKARQAVEIGACRYVNVKPGRVGGLTNAVAIHDLCAAAGVPCWVGGMLESAVGARHCLALATLKNFTYPADVFPSERFYEPDLGQPAIELAAPGRIDATDAPGCGAEPDPDRLARQTIEHARLP